MSEEEDNEKERSIVRKPQMSEEEDNEEDYYDDDMEEDEDDMEDDEEDALVEIVKKCPYVFYTEEDLNEQLKQKVDEVSNLTSLSMDDSRLLLLHFSWNVDKLMEEWFGNEETVRKALGRVQLQIGPLSSTMVCNICFDPFPVERMKTTSRDCCGHYYCENCWKIYAKVSIENGEGCVKLRCPDPPCRSMVPLGMMKQLVDEDTYVKYRRHLLQTFIDSSDRTKWCPAPDCNFAVKVNSSESFGVVCNCSNTFCWNCLSDNHSPVDCDTARTWELKNQSEADNMLWIIAHTKICPSCKKLIEKSLGCMHMTCKCTHEFCWLCLGPWENHGEKTGGFYECNMYQKAKRNGEWNKENEEQKKCQEMLERYGHYYERFHANEDSRKKAIQKYKTTVETTMGSYLKLHGEIKFLPEAWFQIIECRRVLQWTYAYGYFLEEGEKKMELFNYVQTEAVASLERLHSCVEKEGMMFIKDDIVDKDFTNEYKSKLAHLTSVTKVYFDNLVRFLANGFETGSVY